MKFAVGETVVYPHHGAAKIVDISDRTIRGETKSYLTLEITPKAPEGSVQILDPEKNKLTIKVPAENVEKVGVRDVIDKKGVKEVYGVLQAEFIEEPNNWSRRYKANLEKLATGDVLKVSEIVRDLTRRDQDKGVSAGEKRMLAKARQILISELALALNVTEEKASSTLDDVLAA